MEVRIGGADRLMAKIVAHVAQIDRVVRHVRSCCMAQPVRGRTLDPKHVVGIVDAPQPEPLACCGEEMLHNFVDATPTQGAHLAPNRQEEGSRLPLYRIKRQSQFAAVTG